MKITEEYFKLKNILYAYCEHDILVSINSLFNTAKELDDVPLKNHIRSEVHFYHPHDKENGDVYICISFFYFDTETYLHTEVGRIMIERAVYIDKDHDDLIKIMTINSNTMKNAYEEDI